MSLRSWALLATNLYSCLCCAPPVGWLGLDKNGGIAEEAALSFLFFTSIVRLGQGQSSSSFAASKASLTVNRVEVAWP
jgi:hypothetical protein